MYSGGFVTAAAPSLEMDCTPEVHWAASGLALRKHFLIATVSSIVAGFLS